MEKAILIKIAIALFVILFSALVYYIKTRNFFKVQKEEVDSKKSLIEIALTQRFDTLAKLNATVKGIVGHESDVMKSVTQIRKGMTGEELSQVNSELDRAQSQINALAESYPDLKANINFLQMQDTIVDLENTLQAARRLYNEEVKLYNSKVVSLPTSIVAGRMHLQKESFFKAEEHKMQDYKVEF